MEALTSSVNYVLVFLEGVFSFFSPCVIPLLPVYMSYLAGSTGEEENGILVYPRKKVLYNTVFFILGISAAFFLLGASFTLLGRLFGSHKFLLIRISGILIVILGLFQLDFFKLPFLQKERKLHINITGRKVNPLVAFVLGFTFSFAWTPCIGPALSSVLILVSGAKADFTGYLLILLYAAGFLLPFLVLGLFTARILNFLKEKKKIIRYAIKIGGVLLIVMGLMVFTGFMNGISSYLNIAGESSREEKDLSDTASEADFTLRDQYGEEHSLSDYKGKVVFINFYATWCPPCNKELPDIEKLFREYGANQEEVVFLGITNPRSKAYPHNSDEDTDYIKNFLEEGGYTFPTLFDETGEIFQKYGISAFPTTFIFDGEGNVLGYVPGMMTEDIMRNVISQALDAGK